MPERSRREFHVDEPARHAGTFGEPRLHRGDLSGEIAGGVDQVGAVREHVVAAAIRLRIGRRLLRVRAGHDARLHGVGHLVPACAVAVPGFERDDLAQPGLDELPGRLESGIEALHVSDLERQAGPFDGRLQFAYLLDGHPDGFLAEDVFARRERPNRRRDVERIGRGDDHRVHVRIGQHRVVVLERARRAMRDGHPLAKIVGDLTDGVELGVRGLRAAVEVRRLRNLPCTEHAYPQPLVRVRRHETIL